MTTGLPVLGGRNRKWRLISRVSCIQCHACIVIRDCGGRIVLSEYRFTDLNKEENVRGSSFSSRPRSRSRTLGTRFAAPAPFESLALGYNRAAIGNNNQTNRKGRYDVQLVGGWELAVGRRRSSENSPKCVFQEIIMP